MQIKEAAFYIYAYFQICNVLCSFYNARSEPYFLSSENLVKEAKADFCSPINTIVEELRKTKIFIFQSKNLWKLNCPVSLIVTISPRETQHWAEGRWRDRRWNAICTVLTKCVLSVLQVLLTTEAGDYFHDPLTFKSMRYDIRWHTFQSYVWESNGCN